MRGKERGKGKTNIMFLLVHLVGDHVLGGGCARGQICVRVALCDFCEVLAS